MKTRTINQIMSCVFLLICITFIVYEVRKKPRILILHSYDTDYSWVNEVSEGIMRVFEGKPYSIRWHYMDTKRHPDDAFKNRAIRSAQLVINHWQPNVLISIADNAQHVTKPYLNDSHINIVFSGVFADPEEYGFNATAKNVTGIRERWPMNVIKDGIEQVFLPDRESKLPFRIRHIGDKSTTGQIIADEIMAYDWGEKLIVESVSVGNLEDWKQEVAQANEETDLVIFSLYHTLERHRESNSGNNEIVSPAEVMAWTQSNLEKPGLGGWGFYVEQGGMMSIGVSAYEQGEEAAKLAVSIVDDAERPEDLNIEKSKQFLIYLRGSLLEQHGIEVPSIYEAFARANNNYF